MASAINRRRGTTSQRSNKAGILVGLVVALIASALLLGILLGTHLLLNDPLKTAAITEKEKRPLVRGVMRPPDVALQDRADVVVQQEQEPDDVGEKEDDVNDDEKDELPDEQVNDPGNADWNDLDNAEETDDQEEEARKANERAYQNDTTDDFPRDEPAAHKDDKGAIPPDTYPYSLDLVRTYDFTTWKARGGSRFKEYASGDSPYILTNEVLRQSDQLARSRREYVKKAMQFAYGAYEQYAFGHDEVLPQSKSFGDTWGGMGTTLVDSLDTLWLMGLKDEFWRARDWVRDHLDHDHVGSVSVFETTIRSLGGLLSAYDWSGDEAFLKKAEDLGSRLFKAFSSESGIPFGQVNLATGRTNNIGWAGGNAMTAEAGTLQLEFRHLAKMVGKEEFATTSEHVYEVFKNMDPPNGLYPYFVRNQQKEPTFANNKLTFGAMSDSYYEYMLKIWLQGGQTETMYRDMYDKAIEGMHQELLQKSTPSGLTYIADKNGGVLDHKMDHLVCFMGGLLTLGAYTDPEGVNSERAQRDLKTGKALTYTCYQMYARMETGISAEYVQFYAGEDFKIGNGAPHYLLRPEAVESFFILNQLTGDPIYREWGWEVFSAIERYCKTDVAYGSLRSVQETNAAPQNKMESFFLAETLKYLYLLQDPDTEVDVLHKHVFNTEAHPLRIFSEIDRLKEIK